MGLSAFICGGMALSTSRYMTQLMHGTTHTRAKSRVTFAGRHRSAEFILLSLAGVGLAWQGGMVGGTSRQPTFEQGHIV